MAESIKIEIDLDRETLEKSLGETGKTARAEFAKVGDDLERAVNRPVRTLNQNTENLKQTVASIGAVLARPPASAGLFGTISSLTFSSSALFLTAEALEQIDTNAAQAASSILKVSSLISGGLAAGLSLVVLKGSELAQNLGSNLVNSLQNVVEKSNQFIASGNILNRVIQNYNEVTGGAVGSTEAWSTTIDQLGKSLNLSTKELNKSAQEIISVGSQIGLTGKQMRNLTQISAEYAKVNDKDVFQTTLALVNALNGNAVAAQALGVKLNETAVQSFALKEGLAENFRTLSDGEKVQIRFNKLLKQYGNIAGIAEFASEQLADQENALNVTLEKLNAEFGKGVSIIENYNLASAALNTVASVLNESIVQAAGFFSALGARVLQVGGFLVNFGFKLFVVIKAYKALTNAIKGTLTFTDLFNKNIGFLGISLSQLVVRLTAGRVSMEAMNKVGGRLDETLRRVGGSFFVFKKSGSLSILASLRSTFSSLVSIVGRFAIVLAPVGLLLAKIAAVGALIAAPFILLGKALQEVEKRTQAFSTVYAILNETISQGATILQPAIDGFNKLREAVTTLASKAFGFLVAQLTKAVGALAGLLKANPFGVFSDQSIEKITALEQKLKGFRGELEAVAFDIRKIPKATRDLAGGLDKDVVNIKELSKRLAQLRQDFANFGKSDKELILQAQNERLETLRLAFENQMIQEAEFNKLREQVKLDALTRLNEIEKQKNAERLRQLEADQRRVNNIVNNGFANAISGGIQNIVKSLAKGENVFENFGKFLLNTFGDLAIQLGQFYIAQGIAALALKSLDPTGTIAAGAGLVALGAILKSFFGGGGSGATSGVAASGATPAPGQLSTDTGTLADPDTVERAQEQTNLTVNVQGSLIQQQELGEFIAGALSESGARQSTVVTNFNAVTA